MDPDNDGNFKRIDIVAPSRRYMFLAESAVASKEWYDAVRRVIAGEPPAPKSTPNTTSASTSKLSMRIPLPTSSYTESPVAAYSTAATDRWSATNHNEGATSSTTAHATNRHQRSSDHQRHRNGTNNATRSTSAARSAAAAAATRRASVEGEAGGAGRHKARPIRVRLVHKKAADNARKDKDEDEDDEDEDKDEKDDRYGDYAKSSARQPRQHSSSIGQYGSRPSDRQPPTLPSSSSSTTSSSSQRQCNASSYHSRDTSSSSSFVPLRASQPQSTDGLPPPPPGIRSATQLMGARDPREYGGSVQHAPAPGGVYPSQLAGRTGRLPVRTASVIVRELDGGTF